MITNYISRTYYNNINIILPKYYNMPEKCNLGSHVARLPIHNAVRS